jgi:peptidyl-prolyl cis-trans isomerase SurA
MLPQFLGSWTVSAQTASAQKAPLAKSAAAKSKDAETAAPVRGGEQSIVVLVNDEPITAYQIEQRAALLALNSSGGGPELKARAEARWAQIVQDPKTNERFQHLLREKNVRTREEAQALQKQFLMDLQKNMIEQLRREARAGVMPRLRKEAKEDLIEERLKLQEAKKLGIEISDDDVKRILQAIAERNKMTYDQFSKHLKSMGVDISTMAERFRAQRAWRDLIARRYGAQVQVTQLDIDRVLSSAATDNGGDTVELQVGKITLGLPAKIDQTGLAKRFTEAEALRRKFSGCRSLGELAQTIPGAKLDELRYIKPSTIAEPTRSMLLSAKDGDMLPPAATAAGMEVYAVCGRRAIVANEAQRSKTQEELQTKQLETLAQRHMRNLRQDAHIEYR